MANTDVFFRYSSLLPAALLLLAACGRQSASTADVPAADRSQSLTDAPAPPPSQSTTTSAPRSATCAWPRDKAAVSLTYDDSTPTQLTTAVPALERHGLRATFFITDVRKNPEPWSALLKNGHELAAHTLKHPCPRSYDFVPEGDANEDYDATRMAKELDDDLEMLASLGEKAPYTFAYPCGISWLGKDHESYIPLIRERFAAARGVSPVVAGLSPDPFNVPSLFYKTTSADMIESLQEARKDGSWVVYGFHGIGGDWEILSTQAHEEFLSYLAARKDEFYVAPFREIAACLSDE